MITSLSKRSRSATNGRSLRRIKRRIGILDHELVGTLTLEVVAPAKAHDARSAQPPRETGAWAPEAVAGQSMPVETRPELEREPSDRGESVGQIGAEIIVLEVPAKDKGPVSRLGRDSRGGS